MPDSLTLAIRYVWASPTSLLALLPVPLALWQGGQARVVSGVLEVHGGIVSRLLRSGNPWAGSIAAITLGHVVWGADASSLERTRSHERVHVRQYERWGPLFIPVYLSLSVIAAARGLHPYRDNPFEREAYALEEANEGAPLPPRGPRHAKP